jgi:hypothetical protein
MEYLQSYFDESGNLQKDAIISFCGLVANNNEWGTCCSKWRHALAEIGVKEIKASRVFQYKTPLSPKVPALGIECRVKALSGLIEAIRTSVPLAVASVLHCADFRALSEKEQRLLNNGDPTFFNFLQALAGVHKGVKEVLNRGECVVSIVCDDHHQYASQYLSAWQRSRQIDAEYRKTFASIGFADDRFFDQLQMADFFAGIIRAEARHRFFSEPFDLRDAYLTLYTERRFTELIEGFLDGPSLKQLIETQKKSKLRKRSTAAPAD